MVVASVRLSAIHGKYTYSQYSVCLMRVCETYTPFILLLLHIQIVLMLLFSRHLAGGGR